MTFWDKWTNRSRSPTKDAPNSRECTYQMVTAWGRAITTPGTENCTSQTLSGRASGQR